MPRERERKSVTLDLQSSFAQNTGCAPNDGRYSRGVILELVRPAWKKPPGGFCGRVTLPVAPQPRRWLPQPTFVPLGLSWWSLSSKALPAL